MTGDRDELYLTHIAEATALIRATTSGGKDALATDSNLRDATLYRLQTLSESASLLSDDIRSRHPDIPWARIAGFRNRLAHGYVDVNLDRVWQVIEQDLDPLRDVIQGELRHRQGGFSPR